jgi:glutamine---fructose-6-phosphate transaminase (isomerizing)
MTDPQTVTWAELDSQPEAWGRLLDRLASGGAPEVDLGAFDAVVLVGSGSSFYLAQAAGDWIRRRHPLPVRAVPSCEVMLDPVERRVAPRTLVIAFSRSGESSEGLRAVEILKAAGATVLSVSCTEGSTLLGLGDVALHLPEGHEDGLVMLRSFTSMLLALQWMFGTDEDRADLRRVPEAGRAILDASRRALRDLARSRDFDRYVFLASGSSYPLGVEASLKIQEMSISTSESYHSLEYRHGPKSTADAETLIAMIALPDEAHGLRLARDVKDLGAALLVTGPGAEAYREVADLVVPAPEGLDQGSASVLSLLPLQVVAHDTAIRLGRDPDHPANLAKVVIL